MKHDATDGLQGMGGKLVRGLAFVALAAVIGVTSCRAMVGATPVAVETRAR